MIEVFGFWIGVSVVSYFYLIVPIMIVTFFVSLSIKGITEDSVKANMVLSDIWEYVSLKKWHENSGAEGTIGLVGVVSAIFSGFFQFMYTIGYTEKAAPYVEQIIYVATGLDIYIGYTTIVVIGYFLFIKTGNKIYKMNKRLKELEAKLK